jgi:uncharacterized cupin superfamily protein
MPNDDDLSAALAAVGPRLCATRRQRQTTLAALAEATGISLSTRPQVHDGHEWLYVLDGQLQLILGDQDLVLGPGEAAEFETRVPHWFGSAGRGAVEVLSLFARPGERAHLRTRPRAAG